MKLVKGTQDEQCIRFLFQMLPFILFIKKFNGNRFRCIIRILQMELT